MTVVILEDAAEDLESGAQFYESCATGVGDYFLDSILSELLPQLTEFRNEMDLNLSESIHHSYLSTVLRAYSSAGPNNVELALAGRSGMSSRQTLEGLITILAYTVHMIVHILVEIHHFKFSMKDPFWKATGILSVSISKISGVWNDETALKEVFN